MELRVELEAMYVALKLGSNHLQAMAKNAGDAQADVEEAFRLVTEAYALLENWLEPNDISIILKSPP